MCVVSKEEEEALGGRGKSAEKGSALLEASRMEETSEDLPRPLVLMETMRGKEG